PKRKDGTWRSPKRRKPEKAIRSVSWELAVSADAAPPRSAASNARDQPAISARSPRSPCTRAIPVASLRQAAAPFHPSASEAGPRAKRRTKRPSRTSTTIVPRPRTPYARRSRLRRTQHAGAADAARAEPAAEILRGKQDCRDLDRCPVRVRL